MEQKILDLLTKAGCKPELVKAIGESLTSYKKTILEQTQADYAAKVEEAKKICIDETNAHKRELSRRLQIFLETKSAAIEANLSRQLALNESEALSKLKDVKALIEGVELNAPADNGQVKASIEKNNLQIQQLQEERNHAVETANRQTVMAEKAIKRNRELMRENAVLRGNGGNKRQPVTEGRVVQNGQPQTRRIDTARRNGQTSTVRPTIVENQTRTAPVRKAPNVTSAGQPSSFGVNDIAANMDTDLV